jgi:hypothetical protein
MYEYMNSAKYELRYSCIKQTPSLRLRMALRGVTANIGG